MNNVRPPAPYGRILERSHGVAFSMNSDIPTGSLLRTLVASKPGGRFLELGTGCGVGTSWLLDGMDAAASLVSLDNDAAPQTIAREELGADPRVRFVLQDGAVFLDRATEGFDLIYADAWPGKYANLERALALVKPGGIYLVDDMLPQPNWPVGHGDKASALIERLMSLEDFRTTRLDCSTGLIICVRKP